MHTARLRRAPAIATTELDGHLLVLSSGHEAVLHLNEVAGHVWQLLAEDHSLDELAEELAGAYGEPAERVRADLLPLIEVLQQYGVVLPAGP